MSRCMGDHAFIVSEAANHGMQVFDLTRLRTVTAPEQFSADAHLNVFRSAHNIVINETGLCLHRGNQRHGRWRYLSRGRAYGGY